MMIRTVVILFCVAIVFSCASGFGFGHSGSQVHVLSDNHVEVLSHTKLLSDNTNGEMSTMLLIGGCLVLGYAIFGGKNDKA